MTDHSEAPAANAIGFRISDLLGKIVVDMALPWMAVQILERNGVASVPAFALAAVFPVGSVAIAWVRHRRVEAIGIAVTIAILLGICVSFATDDVRFSTVKGAPAFGLFGLACLASLGARRPVMFYVSRYFVAGEDPAKRAIWETRAVEPGFRRAMWLLTVVWGLATLAEAAGGIVFAFVLPPSLTLVAEPALAFGTVALLLFWTTSFARRREARR